MKLKIAVVVGLCILLIGLMQDDSTITYKVPPKAVSDCVLIQSDGLYEWHDAKSNPPKCLDANGTRQGRWNLRYVSGRVDTGDYMNGKQHGQWTFKETDGKVFTHTYTYEERDTNKRNAGDNSPNSLGFINATNGYCPSGYAPSDAYPGKCYKKSKSGDLVKVHSSVYACQSHRDELNLLWGGGYQCSGNRLYRNY